MPALLSISIPQAQVDKLEAALGKATTRQAVYQAVYRTTRAGATIIRKRVQENLVLDSKYINRAIKIRIDNSMGKADATGHITISPELIPLVGYQDGGDGKSGITVVISKNRPPLVLKHAFYARVTNKDGKSHKGIFLRAKGRDISGGKVMKGTYKHLKVGRYEGGRLTKRGYARRLPMEEQFGPSVVDALGPDLQTTIGKEAALDLAETLQKNIESQLKRFQGNATGGES
jgi:hypothetical protein